MAVTLAASLSFWGTTNDSRSVLLAARDLPAGSLLSRDDLAVSSMRVDDRVYQAAIPAATIGDVVGKRLAAPVYAGQVLAQKALSGPQALAPGQLSMTVPLSAADATATVLPQTDVELLYTTDKGKPTAKTVVLLPRAHVIGVTYDDAQAGLNTGVGPSQQRISALNIVVSADQAVQLANARLNGDVTVAVLPPEGS